MLKKLTTTAELKQVLDLSDYAFNFPNISEQAEDFLKLWEHTDNWGILEEQDLTSQILVFPFKVNIFGQEMSMAGIGNVATYPEYRGTGGIRQLFTAIFEDFQEKEVILSYLAPFNQPFYRKFGYEAVFSKLETKVARQDITQLGSEKKGKIIRVDGSDLTWQDRIKKLYDKTLKQDTGSLIREDWWWELAIFNQQKNKYAVCFDEENQPVGYLIYRMEQGEMFIDEVSYLTLFALKKITGFIASHSGTFETFRFNSKLSEDVKLLFSESRPVAQTVNEGMMVKIISIEKFIEKYPFKTTNDLSVTLSITDSSTEWNQGTWQLTVQNGQGRLTRLSGEPSTEVDLEGSIQAWTQVFLGRTSLRTQVFLEKINAKDQEVSRGFSDLLQEGQPNLHDFF